MVPKLILQPMVENAILHGIEPMKDGGRVRITAGLEQQNLLITIEDNGPGMAPEELEQCRAAVYSESGATAMCTEGCVCILGKNTDWPLRAGIRKELL